MNNKEYNLFSDKKVWYGVCIILSLIAFIVYLNGFKIGFYYDDYSFFRNYSNSELIKSLTGDWNFGQRLENTGYRPLINIIFHLIWNLLGANILYYHIFNVFLVVLSGFLAYKIFRIYIADKILIILGSILFVIFSDQFLHRIWLTEFPSMFSNILILLGVYLVTKKRGSQSIKISYVLLIIAALIKETNLPFLIVPIVFQLFNKKHYKITYSIFIQALFVGIFMGLFLYVRSVALNNLSEYLTVHSYKGLANAMQLIKDFIIAFAPSLGLTKYALVTVICLLFGVFFLNIFFKRSFKLRNSSADFYFISILIVLSMASFPFYSGGRLRVFFVCFSLLAFLIFLSKNNREKPFISYAFISFLILVNCCNSYFISKIIVQKKAWIAQSIYFSPFYRNLINRGDADKLLAYLEENDLDKDLVLKYDNLINSLTKKASIVKTGEFVDDLGIKFVSLSVGENKKLNIMKYEFRGKDLGGYPLSTQSDFKPWEIKSDFPINGVRWYRIEELIQHLNKKSSKYTYRLPTVQEYVWLTGNYKTIYEENYDRFAAKSIKSVFNTTPNEFDIYGLQGNVNEWTRNELNSEFVAIFGGDAHYGAHNIIFADHKHRAKCGSMRLYGFRLVAESR